MSIHWGGRGAGHVSRWSASTTGVPALVLDFLTTTSLDSRVTFTRSSTATFVGSNGLIQTAAIDGPRFDYDPVTLAAKGLLIETQRVNLLTYSNNLTETVWVKTNCSAAMTATGPDGAANSATTLTSSAANATVLQSITSASAARATTCYIKRRTGTGTIEMTQNNGTTWASVSVTSSWARVSIPSATVTNPVIGLRIVTSGDAIDVALFQCETGAFATSAIPTLASQVTRSADVATMTGTNFSSWYNQSEGTFVASADTVNTSTASVIMVGTDDNNRVQIGHTGSTDAIFRIANAGTAANPANIVASKLGFKAALAYKQSDAAASVGASAVTTSSPTSMVAHTAAYLGSNSVGGLFLNGHIRSLAYYNTRLLNSQLQTLTT